MIFVLGLMIGIWATCGFLAWLIIFKLYVSKPDPYDYWMVVPAIVAGPLALAQAIKEIDFYR